MSIAKTVKISIVSALFMVLLAPIAIRADGSSIPPSDITNLVIVGGAGSVSVQLTWTAPSADSNSTLLEPATAYDMRVSTAMFGLDQWNTNTLTRVIGTPTPGQPGMQENFTLTGLNPNTTYYVAVRGVDSFGLLSQSANIVNFTTVSAGPATVSGVVFTPRLEGIALPAGRSFTVSFYNFGTLNKAGEFTATSDASGKVALPSNVSFPGGLYDIAVSSPYYLRRKIFEYNLASNASVALPLLPAGDLNSDGIINSLDWSVMRPRWATNDAVADVNKDGIVNSIDWSFLNVNWAKTID